MSFGTIADANLLRRNSAVAVMCSYAPSWSFACICRLLRAANTTISAVCRLQKTFCKEGHCHPPLIVTGHYDIGIIPSGGLYHRVLQRVEVAFGGRLTVGRDVAFGILSVLVATAKVDDAEGAVGVVCGDEAATGMALCQRRLKVGLAGGYNLEHWPRPLLRLKEYCPALWDNSKENTFSDLCIVSGFKRSCSCCKDTIFGTLPSGCISAISTKKAR